MGRFLSVLLGRESLESPIPCGWAMAASTRLDQSIATMKAEAMELQAHAASAGQKLRESMIRCMAALLS